MRDKIMAMEAGRELDMLVAEKITKYQSLTTVLNLDGTYGYIPKYSTDISASWGIIGLFGEKPFAQGRRFFNELNDLLTTEDGNLITWPDALLFLDPIHICKASLLAVMNL